jgi:hypothetical protein
VRFSPVEKHLLDAAEEAQELTERKEREKKRQNQDHISGSVGHRMAPEDGSPVE